MPQVLPERIRRLLAAEGTKGLCSISLLETAILYRLGRLVFQGTVAELLAVGLSSDLALLELTPEIAARTNELPGDFKVTFSTARSSPRLLPRI